MKLMLAALLESYREWGGTASPPVIAIVDWREVPTWSEFEILQARFREGGSADHDLRLRATWYFDGTKLMAAAAESIWSIAAF